MVSSDSGTPPADTASRIQANALNLFRAKGYFGSSIREIASGAGVSVSTLFHHYASKEDILAVMLGRIIDNLEDELNEKVSDSQSPTEQMTAFVHTLVIINCTRASESFVAERELRSLSEERQLPLRTRQLAIIRRMRTIIVDGVKGGVFRTDDPRTVGMAILNMCTSVASWYRPGGDLSPDELAERYAGYALLLLSRPPDESSKPA